MVLEPVEYCPICHNILQREILYSRDNCDYVIYTCDYHNVIIARFEPDDIPEKKSGCNLYT